MSRQSAAVGKVGECLPVSAPTNSIWEVIEGTEDGLAGYLVTRPGDVNHLIAYIPLRRRLSAKPALQLARRIAEAPRLAAKSHDAVDLRATGFPDSTEPVPDEVYSWRCYPVGQHDQMSVRPFPFCPFHFSKMLRQYVALSFTEEALQHHPEVTIGIWNPEKYVGWEHPVDLHDSDSANAGSTALSLQIRHAAVRSAQRQRSQRSLPRGPAHA